MLISNTYRIMQGMYDPKESNRLRRISRKMSANNAKSNRVKLLRIKSLI